MSEAQKKRPYPVLTEEDVAVCLTCTRAVSKFVDIEEILRPGMATEAARMDLVTVSAKLEAILELQHRQREAAEENEKKAAEEKAQASKLAVVPPVQKDGVVKDAKGENHGVRRRSGRAGRGSSAAVRH